MEGIAKSFKEKNLRATREKAKNVIVKEVFQFDEENSDTSLVGCLKVVELTDSKVVTILMVKDDESFKDGIEEATKYIAKDFVATYERNGDYISIIFKDEKTAEAFREALVSRTENCDDTQPEA